MNIDFEALISQYQALEAKTDEYLRQARALVDEINDIQVKKIHRKSERLILAIQQG